MPAGYQHRHNETKVDLPGTKFHILKPCWDKIMGWTEECPSEVSGLGFVKKENLTFTIVEVFLLKQLCGSAYTDLESDYYGKLGTKMISERMDDWNKYGGFRFWWHSHVNMGVFWSGTDLATIERLSKSGDPNAWGLSMVVNKDKKYRMMFEHSSVGIRLDNVDVSLVDEDKEKFLQQCKKEVEEFVFPMSEYELDKDEEKITKKTPAYRGYRSFSEYNDYWSGEYHGYNYQQGGFNTKRVYGRIGRRTVEAIPTGQFDDPDEEETTHMAGPGGSQNLDEFLAESRKQGGFCPNCGLRGESITQEGDCLDNGDLLLVCPSCKESFRVPVIAETKNGENTR